MKTLIAGYRPYELGIFKDTQPEAEVLKQFMREKVRAYAEMGTEWFIIQGYTGIEFYAAEAIMDLREEYGFKFSVLKPFHNFDDRYKEDDQLKLNRILEASDFHNFIFDREYESPKMFRMINQFLIWYLKMKNILATLDSFTTQTTRSPTSPKKNKIHSLPPRLI